MWVEMLSWSPNITPGSSLSRTGFLHQQSWAVDYASYKTVHPNPFPRRHTNTDFQTLPNQAHEIQQIWGAFPKSIVSQLWLQVQLNSVGNDITCD